MDVYFSPVSRRKFLDPGEFKRKSCKCAHHGSILIQALTEQRLKAQKGDLYWTQIYLNDYAAIKGV